MKPEADEARELAAELMDLVYNECRRRGLPVDMSVPVYNAANGSVVINARVRIRRPKLSVAEDARETFKRLAPQFDIDPEWYGMTATIGVMDYTIVGINPARPKRAVVIQDRRGKIFTVDAKIVINVMRAGEPGNNVVQFKK